MQFGAQLKEWRTHRRLSQMDLANEAGISSRHVSFLETGRSRPTEGMILRLSSVLDIPLRAQAPLFSAAGFSPRFGGQKAPTLQSLPVPVADAIRLILDRQNPYPALAFDHEYTVLAVNDALAVLGSAAGLPLGPGTNFLDLYLGSPTLRAIIVNWGKTAADLVRRIRADIRLQGPRSPLSARIEQLAAAPDIVSALETYPHGDGLPVLPVEMKLGEIELRWITTLTTFGSIQDALVEGVMIEQFFPADEPTRAYFEAGASPAPNTSRA